MAASLLSVVTGDEPNVSSLARQEFGWSKRQKQVLDRLARGWSNQQIADDLGISLDGAKWHLREILSTLGVRSREEAAEYWRRRNGMPSRFARAFGAGLHWPMRVAMAATATAAGVAVVLVAAALWAGRADEGDEAPGVPTDTAAVAQTATPTITATATVQTPAPMHTEVTPWGLFVINPVIDGKSLLNPQGMPYPRFDGPTATVTEAATRQELEAAMAANPRILAVPGTVTEGMQFQGMRLEEDGDQYSFDIAFYSGKGTTSVRSLRLTSFTPTEAVPFEEFPDNTIWDFAATHDVNGHPTLTVTPDAKTADPADERIVAWSQGNAVYYIRTTGVFETADLLSLAREVSTQEAAE